MTGRRRTVLLVLATISFGVVMGVVKGDSSGLRSDIGNLSAPWLLVAVLPAATSRSLSRGVVLGTTCSVAALLGFYVTLTVVLLGHLGGGGYARELAVELRANRIYLLAGVVSGPACGAIGAWFGRRRRAWLWLLTGGLLAGEVVAVTLLDGVVLLPRPMYFAWGVDDWVPYLVEASLGVVIAAVAAWSLRPRATRDA